MIQFYRAFSSQPNLLHIVSKLRSQTALSMNMCRKAALESNLDFKLALEILSNSANSAFKSNAASAASNFGMEGLIGVMGSANSKCLIELRCDSDFVSRNPEFIFLADTIMQSIINSADQSVINHQVKTSFDKIVEENINFHRSKFRENIGIESVHLMKAEPLKSQAIGHYIHQRLGNNAGKVGSLVKIESHSSAETIRLEELGNFISRQIVALGDPEINITKLMDSEYLFAPIGTVKKFIEQYEEKINSKIAILDITYAKIK